MSRKLRSSLTLALPTAGWGIGLVLAFMLPRGARGDSPPTPLPITNGSALSPADLLECGIFGPEEHVACCPAGHAPHELTAHDDVAAYTSSACVFTYGGDDWVALGSDDDRTFAISGRNTILDAGGDVRIIAGIGPDVVVLGPGDSTVSLGGEDDVLLGAGFGTCVIDGEDGDDVIAGGGGSDLVDGGPGADYLIGGAGNDSLVGGRGDDTLEGGHGNDVLHGNEDNDVIVDLRGDNRANGGDGDDQIVTGRGNDELRGGAGRDELYAGRGDDVIVVSHPCELVKGEVIRGGPGHDVLRSPLPLEGLVATGVDIAGIEEVVLTESGPATCAPEPGEEVRFPLHTPESRALAASILTGGGPLDPVTDRYVELLAAGDFAALAAEFGPESPRYAINLADAEAQAQSIGSVMIQLPPAASPINEYTGPGDPGVPRWSCCNGVPVRSQPQGGEILDELEFSEPVRLLGVRVCTADVLDDPTNWTNVNAVARIRTRDAVEGFVPFASLFRRPFTPTTDSMTLEMGFGLMGEILRDAIQERFNPPGCEESPSTRTVEGPAIFWCSTMSELCTSLEHPSCEGCYQASLPGPNECEEKFQDCAETVPNPEEAKSLCAGSSASWEECMYQDLDGSPSIFCDDFVEPNSSITVLRGDDYLCGELPVGTTHVGCEASEDSKRLLFWNLWASPHAMDSGRLSAQQDTTSSAVTNLTDFSSPVDVPGVMGAGNVWLHVAPEPPNLRMNACILVPRMKLFGPHVNYIWYFTPGGAISEMDWGTYTLDHTVLCAAGTARITEIDGELRPTVEWGAISAMDTVLDSVDDLEIRLSGLGHFLFFTGFNLVPTLSHTLSSAVAVAFGENAEVLADIYFDSEDHRGNLIKFVLAMDEVEKAKRLLRERLNEISADFTASDQANLSAQLTSMCDNLIPDLAPDDALYWPMQFIAMHRRAVAERPGVVGFVPNAASETAACYDQGLAWSPGDIPPVGPPPWWARYSGQSWLHPGETDQGCRLGFRLQGDLDQAVWPVLRCALGETNLWLNNGRPGGNPGLATAITQACTDEGLAAFEDLYGTPQQIADDLQDRVEVITCGF